MDEEILFRGQKYREFCAFSVNYEKIWQAIAVEIWNRHNNNQWSKASDNPEKLMTPVIESKMVYLQGEATSITNETKTEKSNLVPST